MKRVLLVDDTPDNLALLQVAFSQFAPDAKTETAGTAADALELYRAAPFHAIVSDIAMPNESGLKFIESIRGEGGAQPQVFFYTAFDGALNRHRAQDLDATGYFVKPFPLRDLVERVMAQLESR